MKRRTGLALAAFLLAVSGVQAQAQTCSGAPAANQICAGPSSGGAAFGAFRPMVGADIDAVGGTARGSILERGAAGWAGVAPGTSGLPYVSNGAGADSGYQALTSTGIAAGAAATNIGALGGDLSGTLPNPTVAKINGQTGITIGGAQGQALIKNSATAGDASWRDTCLNIEAFGGVGNNSTDNVTPLTNAFAALTGTGGCIYFPPGKYKFTAAVSLSMPNSIFSTTIVGGGADSTILTWPAASGGLTINYLNAGNSAHVRDLSFTTGTTNGGNALVYNSASVTPQPVSDVYRVIFRGDDGFNVVDWWTIGFAINNVSNVNVDGIMVDGAGTSGSGITIVGLPASSKFATQINVSKGVFQSLGTGILYGSFVQGVAVDQTNFTGVTNGIASAASETGTLAQLSVTNSQFGIAGAGNGILTSTAIVGVQLANNYFICNAASCTAVALSQASWFQITGNYISSTSTTSTTGINVLNMPSGTGGAIVNNAIFGFNVGISLATGIVAGAKVGAQFNVTSIGNTTAIATGPCGGTCTTTTNY